MTYTLRLPFLDTDGTLSALVHDAILAGATADRGLANNADDTFDLTFPSQSAATAFKANLGEDIVVTDLGDVVVTPAPEPEPTPAPEPVEPEPEPETDEPAAE